MRKLRVLKVAVVALVLLVLAACMSGESLADKLAAFEASKDMWLAEGITSYAYTYDFLCLCDDTSDALPARITVTDGVVVSVVSVETDDVVDEAFALTMLDQFDKAEERLNNRDYSTSVGYDGTYGFPTYISVICVDRDEEDCGETALITDFEVLD